MYDDAWYVHVLRHMHMRGGGFGWLVCGGSSAVVVGDGVCIDVFGFQLC